MVCIGIAINSKVDLSLCFKGYRLNPGIRWSVITVQYGGKVFHFFYENSCKIIENIHVFHCTHIKQLLYYFNSSSKFLDFLRKTRN